MVPVPVDMDDPIGVFSPFPVDDHIHCSLQVGGVLSPEHILKCLPVIPAVGFNYALQYPGSSLGNSLGNDPVQGDFLMEVISSGQFMKGFCAGDEDDFFRIQGIGKFCADHSSQ